VSSERHPRPSGIRLSPRHERWVLGISIALLISGVLWLAFHYMLTVPGEFGESRHPLEAWWLRLHGAAAMAFLVAWGTLLPIHIRRAWQLRRNYRTGVVMFSVVTVLVTTGYGLYYASGENLRLWMSVIHWGIGITAMPALILHVLIGKRSAANLQLTQRRQRQRQPLPAERAKRTSA
jgi:cation transport ATPase